MFWKALNLNWRLLERSLKEKHDKILDGCGTNAPARLTVPMSLPRVLSHFPPHPRVNFMQICVHPLLSKNSTCQPKLPLSHGNGMSLVFVGNLSHAFVP